MSKEVGAGGRFDIFLDSVYSNNVLVKPIYVKLLKEGESKYRVAAFFCN